MSDKSDVFAEMAKEQVTQEGDKVIYEFALTKGTPTTCLHVSHKTRDVYMVFFYGRLICMSPSWDGATLIASALARTDIECHHKVEDGAEDNGSDAEKGEGRDW